MKRLVTLCLVASGCIDFDAISADACATKGLCGPTPVIIDVGYCQPCTSSLQCGGGDNLCIRSGTLPRFCGVACADDSDCGSGNTCGSVRIEDGGRILNCVPTFPFLCDGGVRDGVTLDGGVDAGADAGTRDGGSDGG